MSNARTEFKRHTKGLTVKCALVHQNRSYWDEEEKKPEIVLPVGYDAKQYEDFLSKLNFEYYAGFGGQELFGMIWYTDGSWSHRGEYDGIEWWEHNSLPEIPEYIKGEGK